MTSRLATQDSKSKNLNIPILDIQSGATGLAAFLNDIPTFLNCYGHAGFEFIHAIDYSPKMPTLNDLAPSTSASHLHPTSPSDITNRRESISTTLFDDIRKPLSSGVKETSHPTLKLPQVAYMYERSSSDSSSTTANGHSLYLQDRKDWKDESKDHLKDRAECMSFLLINCFPPSTHKTIKKNRNFPAILQSNDLVAFNLLLHSLLVESTLIANVSSLATLFNIRQDSLSLEDFGNNVDDAMKLFTDQFCTDPHNPTMVDATTSTTVSISSVSTVACVPSSTLSCPKRPSSEISPQKVSSQTCAHGQLLTKFSTQLVPPRIPSQTKTRERPLQVKALKPFLVILPASPAGPLPTLTLVLEILPTVRKAILHFPTALIATRTATS